MANRRSTILCVDDEPIVLVALQEQLKRALPQHAVETAESAEEALEVLAQLAAADVPVPLVISDQLMPVLRGDELLARIHRTWPSIRAVMLTGQADADAVGRAVNEARLYRYLSKPWQQEDLVLTARGAIEAWQAEIEQARLVASLEAEVAHRRRVSDELLRQANERTAGPLLGNSEAARRLRSEVSAQARHDAPLLIRGAPGTGLEAAARAIHAESSRARGPFLVARGAMTANAAELEEHLSVARGGTLFIHGIERLSPPLQRQLARFVSAPAPETRVIAGALGSASTTEPTLELQAAIHARLDMPLLRDRTQDIEMLAAFFLADAAQRTGQVVDLISPASFERMRHYSWPGNISELRQVIEQAVVRAEGPIVEVEGTLFQGATSLGNYTLIDLIGEGGMGQVWRATHRLLSRPAAVKLIRHETVDASSLERFRREARAIARLRSPHTIELYDFGVADDGQLYFAMEMLEGLDLKTLVETHGPLSEARAVFLLRQACLSLAEAHAAGLVHRDIKPANLFVARLGADADFLKVLDFGTVTADDRTDRELTGELAVPGTAAYLSPEAASGDAVDARADLYALGCTMWFMVTGKVLFPSRTPVAMIMAHLQTPPPFLRDVGVTQVSAGYEALMRACLAKSRDERPASALDAEAALDRLELAEPWTVARARAWWDQVKPTQSLSERDATSGSFTESELSTRSERRRAPP